MTLARLALATPLILAGDWVTIAGLRIAGATNLARHRRNHRGV